MFYFSKWGIDTGCDFLAVKKKTKAKTPIKKQKKRKAEKIKLITGIDEAGRGAVVGPMVICGITAEESVVDELREIGVRDSKQLSPARREELYKKIKEIIQTKSAVSIIMPISISSCKIDMHKKENTNLNMVEAKTMGQIIDMIGGEEVYIDALTSRPERFGEVVRGYMKNKNVKIIAENKADVKYIIVAAASIIAKVERDRAIDKIKKKENYDFGVGYPHDERTIEFVDMLIKTRKRLPSYVRKTWITTQVLQERNWQRRIKDFILKK